MSDIKVVYFDIRGKGEIIRLLLHAASVEFTDERVTFDDWKNGLKNTLPTPTGQLPYIEYNGKIYAESQAIARFLAKKYGFVGKSDEDNLLVDSVTCQLEDVREAVYHYKHMDDEEQIKATKEVFVSQKCPRAFERFEKLLAENEKSESFVGESFTLSDFNLFDVSDLVENEIPGFVSNYPAVNKLRQKISAIPGIAAYLKNRKQTNI